MFGSVAVPLGVVRLTDTVPAGRGGVSTETLDELVDTIDAAMPPKLTADVPTKSVPVIVTVVPPSVEPEFGEIKVIVGGGGR